MRTSNSGQELSSPDQPSEPTSGDGQSSSSELPISRERLPDDEAVDAIAALMAGDEPAPPADTGPLSGDGEPVEGGGEGEGEAEGDKPPELGRLDELAAKLDMPLEKVYDLELTTGDGEAVKLGDLKDAWQDRESAARETVQRSAALDTRETEIMAEATLWGQLGQHFQQVLPEGAKAELARRQEAKQARERNMLMDAIPEFQDPAKFAAFRDDAVEALSAYGFKPHELTINDHRLLVVLRDFTRNKARLDKLLSFDPKAAKPDADRPSRRTSQRSVDKRALQRAATGSETDKVDAIARLIK